METPRFGTEPIRHPSPSIAILLKCGSSWRSNPISAAFVVDAHDMGLAYSYNVAIRTDDSNVALDLSERVGPKA